MMRILIGLCLLLLCLFCTQCTNSLNGNLEMEDINNDVIPSNSYAYKYQGTTINYSYAENSQTHDYSNNWDFDGDGILDKIMFTGNGGAHLYYRLLIHISGIDSFFYFPYLLTDTPIYEPNDSLKSSKNGTFPVFVVNDFNDDEINDIYLHTKNDKGSNELFIVSYNKREKKITVSDFK